MTDEKEDPPGRAIATPDTVSLAFKDMSDLGNAERLIARTGDKLINVGGLGWLAYDGSRWSVEHGSRLAAMAAHDVAKGLREELASLYAIDNGDADPPGWLEKKNITATRLKKLTDWATASGNTNRTAGMLSQAAQYLAADRGDFDQDPYSLNCKNGTLRLRKDPDAGNWRITVTPHDPTDRITRLADVDYDPQADCPLWLEHLATVLPDEDVREFFRKCVGYALTGDVSEQLIIMLQGRGGDGKSTTMNVIRAILGDYSRGANVQTFMAGPDRTGSEASPDLARLAGDTRLVLTSEPRRGKSLSEERIKTITGGGTIEARDLHESFFEYVARFKLFLECNSRPRIAGDDDGIWRRIIIIMFPHQFKGTAVDKRIDARLIAEGPGILNWALEGSLAWLEAGSLEPPDAVAEAVEDYRRSANPFGEWLAERLDLRDPLARELAADLFADYESWCVDNGVDDRTKLSRTKFGRTLGDRQILVAGKDGKGKIIRRGAKLRAKYIIDETNRGNEELDDRLGTGLAAAFDSETPP